MRVPVEWLAAYVDLPADATGTQIAADLVRVGLEEEGLHGGEITGPLVVGRVLTVEPKKQKNGKTINWCTVDVGSANGTGEPQGIVCGAHNFGPGDLVAVILPGGVLPGDFRISARKTYGHISAGMICSVKELGIGEDHDGILVLADHLGEAAADLQPGQDAISLLGLDHEVVEVNVTPDRGYCFSLRGIAREYALSTGVGYRDPAAVILDVPDADPGHPVRIEDDSPIRGEIGCARYVARTVHGLDLTRRTPGWMATRLTEAGMRPISLAVDVTNYVMLALGQPLHAFDLSTLTDREIVVRRARAGERLTTLDDVERRLDPEDLLITAAGPDSDEVLALAGVMGGASSEVDPTSTTDVLIEAAWFEPRSVARTARRHKLSTEASKRFERVVDPELADRAAQLAVDLLVTWGGGTASKAITDADRRIPRPPISFDTTQPARYVGVDYSQDRVIEILTSIGCQVGEPDTTRVEVNPPSWRPDLTTGPDLVEEVARIDGYDRIPSILPAPPGGRGLTHAQRSRRVVSTSLAAQGLVEVVTQPFLGAARFDEFGLSADDPRRHATQLLNPLSEEAPLLRTELIQTLVDAARRNISRGQRDVALFEISAVSRPDGSLEPAPVPGVGAKPDDSELHRILAAVPDQRLHLGIVAAGDTERSGWWGRGRPVEAADVVSWVSQIARLFGLHVSRRATECAPWHPGRVVEIVLDGISTDGAAQTVIGVAGELHPKVLTALGLPPRTVAAEVDLETVLHAGAGRRPGSPISTHPSATSDVALSVPRSVPAARVEEALRRGAGELLESIEMFDRYTGDQIAAAEQSLAFRLTFRAADRTLTTEEVNVARDAAVAEAGEQFGAVQR